MVSQHPKKVSHLAIGAHQDDVEIMAAHGIKASLENEAHSFGAIICTDGGGSARTGPYSEYTDEQMKEVRSQEQTRAAEKGKYHFLLQLRYPSVRIKNQINPQVVDELKNVLDAAQPDVIYTHNPFDKHQTHVAVVCHVIEALKQCGDFAKKTQLLGCEVWRNLDWLRDSRKVALDLTGFEDQVQELVALHHSQTVGGKRYDLATLGRMKANATFFESHATDESQALWYAVDLSSLITEPQLSVSAFCEKVTAELQEDVLKSVNSQMGE